MNDEISVNFVLTSYGKVNYYSVGKSTDPLFLIIHGSGPKNSGEVYYTFLYEYSVRFLKTWPLFLVAIDCPGYGKSSGSKEAIRAFPESLIKEFVYNTTGKSSAFILMGHSQGGNSIFNAILSNPNLSTFIVQDRPVCGNIKKLSSMKTPLLLVYDEEDDGHPIRQGKEIIKHVKNYSFISYKNSVTPYWFSDMLMEEIIKFVYKNKSFISIEKEMPNFDYISEYNGIDFSKVNNNLIVSKNKVNKSVIKNNDTNRLYNRLQFINENKTKDDVITNFYSNNSKERTKKENIRKNESNEKNLKVEKEKIDNINSRSKVVLSVPKNKKIQNNYTQNYRLYTTSGKTINEKETIGANLNDNTISNISKNQCKEIYKQSQLIELNEKAIELEISKNDKLNYIEQNDLNCKITDEKDLKCTLCLDYFIRPITLPCKHSFCYYCIDVSMIYNPTCPLCRTKFELETVKKIISEKNVDFGLENLIIKQIGEEEMNRKISTIKKNREKDEKNNIIIEYGNSSIAIGSSNSNTKNKVKHSWKLFVKVVKSPYKNPIKHVEFYINPHIEKAPPVKILNGPFEFERNGSYEFQMKIKIYFIERLKIDPYETDHNLTLNGKINSKRFIVNSSN